MRAVPIPVATPGTGQPLPTPVVRQKFQRQGVDLKSTGATIAVTTLADNPFESGHDVTVVTQASGGMSPPPPSMQSRGLVHSFMPGIGESATETQAKDNTTSGWQTLLTTGAGITNTVFADRIAQQDARAREADARAAEARAQADIARAQADSLMARTTANVGGFQFNWALVALGGVGLLAAFLLSRKKD